ncbi:MAG: twin-arginine translocase subunit TatB [Moraxellaceae bacterium]|nr:MAG: twin-arginine translocase subunit TatB [Moraxellaceae bacterium]
MFDIGFFELILIGIIGLVVLGPERLPHAIRMTSAWIGKFRRASLAVKEELENEINTKEMTQRIQEQMNDLGLDEQTLKQSLDLESAGSKPDSTLDSTTAPTSQTPEPPSTP